MAVSKGGGICTRYVVGEACQSINLLHAKPLCNPSSLIRPWCSRKYVLGACWVISMPLCRTDAKMSHRCGAIVSLCLKQVLVLWAGARILFTLHLVCLCSSRLPLPNCSHHSSRVSGSASEGPRKDSVWGSPGSTSHSHPCLPRVSTGHESRVLCTTVSKS